MAIVRCTLSGSFRRDIEGLDRNYRELVAMGCQVLSPHRLDVEDSTSEFVLDKAEVGLSVEQIESHHLLALKQSDILWLHCPGGYIGPSAAMEIGYAAALRKPIFTKSEPQEAVFKDLVVVVPSVFMALEQLRVKKP